eukprot:1158791-Pelagomonas_calceolata.AAC.2
MSTFGMMQLHALVSHISTKTHQSEYFSRTKPVWKMRSTANVGSQCGKRGTARVKMEWAAIDEWTDIVEKERAVSAEDVWAAGVKKERAAIEGNGSLCGGCLWAERWAGQSPEWKTSRSWAVKCEQHVPCTLNARAEEKDRKKVLTARDSVIALYDM